MRKLPETLFRGRVKRDVGKVPIPNVNILLKTLKRGTQTDEGDGSP